MASQKTLTKKELILIVCSNFEKIHGRTYLQKLFFILKKDLKLDLFNYDAHFFGPYSRDLNDNIKELVEAGFLKENSKLQNNGTECYVYALTKTGEKKVKESKTKLAKKQIRDVERICSQFSSFTPTQLLKFVYKKYPTSAENSIFFDDF